jgi:hypothetical protein
MPLIWLMKDLPYTMLFFVMQGVFGVFFLEKTKGGKSVPAKDHDSSSRGDAT